MSRIIHSRGCRIVCDWLPNPMPTLAHRRGSSTARDIFAEIRGPDDWGKAWLLDISARSNYRGRLADRLHACAASTSGTDTPECRRTSGDREKYQGMTTGSPATGGDPPSFDSGRIMGNSEVNAENRWDEKAGLRRDAVGSQVIDVL